MPDPILPSRSELPQEPSKTDSMSEVTPIAPNSHSSSNVSPFNEMLLPQLSQSKLSPSSNTPVNLPTENQNDAATTERISSLKWISRSVSTLLSSTETYSSIGNVLISLNSWTGIIGHTVCGLWAIQNHFINKYFPKANNQHEIMSSDTSRGFVRYLKELLYSPGIYRTGLMLTFSFSTVESIARGYYLLATAFILMAFANAAVAGILNEGYWSKGPRNWLEKTLSWAWSKVPQRLQSILVNPAPAWCAADLLIGAIGLETSKLSSPWFLAPAGLATVGILYGVLPSLWRSGFHKASSTSLLLNAATNVSFAVSNFVYGSTINATALILWTVSSTILAHKRHKDASQSFVS